VANKEKLAVEIPVIDVLQMEITLIGDSPLICHKWSQKAKQQMLDKQMKKAKPGKEAKDPEADYQASMYHHPEGGYGFPCVAFKAAAVGACRYSDGIAMTQARGAFHVGGELAKLYRFARGEDVNGRDHDTDAVPAMREDMVIVGRGVADIRYRGEFKEWSVELLISYNSSALSPEQIGNLFNIAGFGVGVGEWRPEKNGSYGRFHVA
jgi:hypothetical protein